MYNRLVLSCPCFVSCIVSIASIGKWLLCKGLRPGAQPCSTDPKGQPLSRSRWPLEPHCWVYVQDPLSVPQCTNVLSHSQLLSSWQALNQWNWPLLAVLKVVITSTLVMGGLAMSQPNSSTAMDIRLHGYNLNLSTNYISNHSFTW